MPKPKKSQTDRVEKSSGSQDSRLSFAARIMKALLTFGTKANGTEFPQDQSNSGPLIAEAYMWDRIVAYAKKKSDAAWAKLETEAVINDYSELDPGKHEIGYSQSFVVKADISVPVKRFDPEELAAYFLKSKYRVPQTITLQAVEAAKVPKKSNRTVTIEERGV